MLRALTLSLLGYDSQTCLQILPTAYPTTSTTLNWYAVPAVLCLLHFASISI